MKTTDHQRDTLGCIRENYYIDVLDLFRYNSAWDASILKTIKDPFLLHDFQWSNRQIENIETFLTDYDNFRIISMSGNWIFGPLFCIEHKTCYRFYDTSSEKDLNFKTFDRLFQFLLRINNEFDVSSLKNKIVVKQISLSFKLNPFSVHSSSPKKL